MNSILSPAVARPDVAGLSLRVLLRAVRPGQWPKNLLVFGAPAAAGLLFNGDVLLSAGLAFVAFTLAASGAYLINDTIDAPADRLHPVKRHRPIAAGIIPGKVAVPLGVIAILLSLIPAAVLARPRFVITLMVYVALTLSYSLWLKSVVVVDLVAVASGFGLRAVGGAFAIGVPVSQWFLIVSFFGALFVVAGKRLAEHQRLGDEAGLHRSTLVAYADFYSQHVMTLSSGVTLVGFGLWAHDNAFLEEWWFLVSLMLLVTLLLRFALLAHVGAADDPVETTWRDLPLRIMAVSFLVLVVTGIGVN